MTKDHPPWKQSQATQSIKISRQGMQGLGPDFCMDISRNLEPATRTPSLGGGTWGRMQVAVNFKASTFNRRSAVQFRCDGVYIVEFPG